MTDVITVLAVLAGVVWLGIMLVSAFRNRGGGEEISPNLKPGIDDQHLETRRLEGGQKAAIVFAGFLAVSLPLYYLGEQNRQEGFVDEFHEASVERGAHIVEEFACFNCHGPLGAGGSAGFVEPRSGVTVTWEAPSLNDVLYRYDKEELTFWITFGRGNTPMPPWGLPGGGPLNENQVLDVVAYLESIQIPQQDAVDETPQALSTQRARLEGADASVTAAIINQRQVLKEIDQAESDHEFVRPLADMAADILEKADEGLDTDDDGLSDTAESQLSAISAQVYDHFVVVDRVTLDPATADADLVDAGLDQLEAGIEDDPILEPSLASILAAIEADQITDENPDTDGDGISDAGEGMISGLFAEASQLTVPTEVTIVNLDPTNPESVSGVRDTRTAGTMVGGLETTAINLGVTVENRDRIQPKEEAGLDFLLMAQEQRAWEYDIPAIAGEMGVSTEEAERAVLLFNANCARCHTSGFSAGVAFTQEAGSGGFGPALWDGRPVVQFGQPPEDEEETDLFVDFLIKGSEPQTPYGLNGFGSGRMPAFGAILSEDDIVLLTKYLRTGNLTGME